MLLRLAEVRGFGRSSSRLVSVISTLRQDRNQLASTASLRYKARVCESETKPARYQEKREPFSRAHDVRAKINKSSFLVHNKAKHLKIILLIIIEYQYLLGLICRPL